MNVRDDFCLNVNPGWLRAAGFAGSDVQAFSPTPRKANLVGRLRGTGKRKPILLLAHTDVVDARREDWSFDPFKLTEREMGVVGGAAPLAANAACAVLLYAYRGGDATCSRSGFVRATMC